MSIKTSSIVTLSDTRLIISFDFDRISKLASRVRAVTIKPPLPVLNDHLSKDIGLAKELKTKSVSNYFWHL